MCTSKRSVEWMLSNALHVQITNLAAHEKRMRPAGKLAGTPHIRAEEEIGTSITRERHKQCCRIESSFFSRSCKRKARSAKRSHIECRIDGTSAQGKQAETSSEKTRTLGSGKSFENRWTMYVADASRSIMQSDLLPNTAVKDWSRLSTSLLPW